MWEKRDKHHVNVMSANLIYTSNCLGWSSLLPVTLKPEITRLWCSGFMSVHSEFDWSSELLMNQSAAGRVIVLSYYQFTIVVTLHFRTCTQTEPLSSVRAHALVYGHCLSHQSWTWTVLAPAWPDSEQHWAWVRVTLHKQPLLPIWVRLCCSVTSQWPLTGSMIQPGSSTWQQRAAPVSVAFPSHWVTVTVYWHYWGPFQSVEIT
jgi:hypothetical protein